VTLSAQWVDALRARFAGRARFGEPLAKWTYFQVGGPADALVVPSSEADLADLLRMRRALAGPPPLTVIGLGTNLVVRDGGVRGIVVAMTEGFAGVDVRADGGAVLLTLGASVPVCDVTALTIDRSLTGFEFATGVPGSIGGAVFMNAGTREGEIADVLVSARLMDAEGSAREVPRGALAFSYRRVDLDPGSIILGATLRLRPGDASAIRAKCDSLVAWRTEKQPGDLPCAGSIFRNPEGVAAGRLIDQAGLKGRRIGGAVVSPKHTNFIVSDGTATARDILALIELVRETVLRHSGVRLETEVKVIGDDDV
jgi:UDP-N-acetylmuramate dehydrogenase